MNVVKSASASDIESASYVFEQVGTLDCYMLIKARYSYGMHVGHAYSRNTAEVFASVNPGTLIIEGGNAMKSESTEVLTLNQRTITLVTIPKEVADAIVYLRKLGWNNAELIKAAVTGGYAGDNISVIAGYASEYLETLLSALVNGYVIEKSAEEMAHDAIRTRYLYLIANAEAGSTAAGYAAMETVRTLDELGIKISEVNA